MFHNHSRWNKECKEREKRQVCHQSFWCAEDRAHAINLSHGGMCFRIARRAEPGETITLHQGPTLQVKARIAWTRRLENCTEVGVQFLDHPAVVSNWLSSLEVTTAGVARSSKGEPILALPAPGQTFHPPFNAVRLQAPSSSSSARPLKMGKSWKAAVQLMNTSSSTPPQV